MTIKLPKDISGLKILHLTELYKFEQEEAHTVEQMVNYVSLFSGVDSSKLIHADIIDIQRAYIHCLKILSSYEKKSPQKKIRIKGVDYKLVPTSRQTGGWYIDVKANAKQFEEEPELVAAFNYIEQGMSYSQTDKYGNIINPLRDRAKIFRDHFPADVYLNLNGFFLQKLEVLTKGFLILSREREQETMSKMITEMK